MKTQKTSAFLVSLIKPHSVKLAVLSLCNFITSVTAVFLALISKRVIDTATGAREGEIINECLLLGGVVIFQILVLGITNYLASILKIKLDITLKKRIFSAFIHKNYKDASAYHSGEIINRLTSDSDAVVIGVAEIIPSAISIFTRLLASLVLIIYFSWYFAAAVLVIGGAFSILFRIIGKRYKALHKKSQAASGEVRSFMQESVQNLVVVKTYDERFPVEERLSDLIKKEYRLRHKKTILSVLAHIGINLIFSGGYYIALGWGAVQVAATALTFGDLTAFLQLISHVRAPFMSISGILTKYYSCIASAERLIELEGLENDENKGDLERCEFENILIDKVTFSYENECVIEEGSAEIKAGEITTFVGGSGAGKSTVFKLLLALYNADKGEVRFNLKNGESVPASAATRRLFTYVPQGNFILSGTVKENISFFNRDIDDDTVFAAAKAAEIYDDIMAQPDGFDTLIGERGHGFSEGQIQRIAIARALLFDSPILLLDECTSALDEETERKILENIQELKSKTVIFITHRPNAVEISDSVFRIADKKITKEK